MDFLSNFREEFLYNFINSYFEDNKLKLKPVYIDGKLINKKSKFAKVTDMQRIKNTNFPDIDKISINYDLKGLRPAEVKFRTSQFDYHSNKKYKEKYLNFKLKSGCVIVAKHDYLPVGLEDESIDVYELIYDDLWLFGKINYDKFLNTQVREHIVNKVWIMETSLNFYQGSGDVKAAIESNIWCPTDKLTSYELDVNDIVIFIKTHGASKQEVQKYKIPEDWFLDELFIAKVTKPIMSRKEYCQLNNLSYLTPLWYDETEEGHKNPRVRKRSVDLNKGEWRWKRVFEFERLNYYRDLNIRMLDLEKIINEFCNALIRTYGAGCSTEISKEIFEQIIRDIFEIKNRIEREITL